MADEGTAQLGARSRSRAYQVFSEAFAYPEGERLERIASGRLAASLSDALAAVSPALGADMDARALAAAGEGDSLAVEYSRLFDVGPTGPPCPLHGGLWAGDRMRSMEEVLRFYEHFDLAPEQTCRELPDHLALELEFLHFLSFRAAQALAEGNDAGPYLRAERDFLARHPGRFVPLLRAALVKERAAEFFVALAQTLEGLLKHASGELETAPPNPPR